MISYSENQTIHIGKAKYHGQTVYYDIGARTSGTVHMNGRIWQVVNNAIDATRGYGYARSWTSVGSEPARTERTSLVQRKTKYHVSAHRKRTSTRHKHYSFVVDMLQYCEEALLTSLGANMETTPQGHFDVTLTKGTTYFRGTRIDEYDPVDGYTGDWHRYDTYLCKQVEIHIKVGMYLDHDEEGNTIQEQYSRMIVPTSHMDIIHPHVLNHREEWVHKFRAGGNDLMQKDLPLITHPTPFSSSEEGELPLPEDEDDFELGDLDEHPF